MGTKYKVTGTPKHKDHLGECDNNLMEIRVLSTLTEREWNDVFIHEIIHAILFVSGTGALLRAAKDEEAVVTAIGNGLAQLGYLRRRS